MAKIITKHGRPITDSKVIKEYILAIAEEVSQDHKNIFENTNLSTRTCTRGTEGLGSNFCEKFKDKASSFMYFSLAMSESTDVWDTAQFLIFVRRIDKICHLYEELFQRFGLNGTTKGEDLFHPMEQDLVSRNLNWDKQIGITTDGRKNMSGHYKGMVEQVNSKLLELGP